jgi:hypothetical protein
MVVAAGVVMRMPMVVSMVMFVRVRLRMVHG